jgi:hypothetical protein
MLMVVAVVAVREIRATGQRRYETRGRGGVRTEAAGRTACPAVSRVCGGYARARYWLGSSAGGVHRAADQEVVTPEMSNIHRAMADSQEDLIFFFQSYGSGLDALQNPTSFLEIPIPRIYSSTQCKEDIPI